MLCRDSELLNVTDLPTGLVDRIYATVLPSSEPKINFIQFIEGLRHVALEKRISLNEVGGRPVLPVCVLKYAL